LLPLQTVRGNFARIHSALNELLGLSERASERAGDDARQLDLAAVQLAVQDAVAMFQRQAQGLLQVGLTINYLHCSPDILYDCCLSKREQLCPVCHCLSIRTVSTLYVHLPHKHYIC